MLLSTNTSELLNQEAKLSPLSMLKSLLPQLLWGIRPFSKKAEALFLSILLFWVLVSLDDFESAGKYFSS